MKSAKSKPRVVVDTSVWVSALIFGGNAENVARLFVDKVILITISEELLSELKRVVDHKFPLFMPKLNALEASLREDADWVRLGTKTVTVSRDPDDNKFIETALIGNCAYIISGDRHLLEIKRYQGVQIIKPAAFLKLLRSDLGKR